MSVNPHGLPCPKCSGDDVLERLGGALQCLACGHRYSVEELLLRDGADLLNECLPWVPASFTLGSRLRAYLVKVSAYLKPTVEVRKEEEEG